jgi:hypothetical protein
MKQKDKDRLLLAAEMLDDLRQLYSCNSINAVSPYPDKTLRNKYVDFYDFPSRVRDFGLSAGIEGITHAELREWRVLMLLFFAEAG